MTLRPIQPLVLPVEAARAADFGKKPEVLWAPPASLLVDEEYQRDLNRRSIKLIHKIVAGFAWRKVKPPIVVRVDGGLHVIDGQHTAIAAATLKIPQIMVFVVDAATALERADSFVAHNQDRLTMSPLDIYRAKLGGRDPDACAIDAVCRAAGIRFRVTTNFTTPKVGDTGAIGVVSRMVKRRGSAVAETVLRALVDGERAPISAAEIEAAEAVICDSAAPISAEHVARAARELGSDGVIGAAAAATSRRVAVKVVLVERYRRIAGEKRKVA